MREKFYIKRDAKELGKLSEFLKDFLRRNNISEDFLYNLELSVEEVVMNMIRHNTDTDEDIQIIIEKTNAKIILSLSDHEKTPFDITKISDVDFEAYFQEEKHGGLGIHLIKQIMDELTFEHKKGISTIHMVKKL